MGTIMFIRLSLCSALSSLGWCLSRSLALITHGDPPVKLPDPSIAHFLYRLQGKAYTPWHGTHVSREETLAVFSSPSVTTHHPVSFSLAIWCDFIFSKRVSFLKILYFCTCHSLCLEHSFSLFSCPIPASCQDK